MANGQSVYGQLDRALDTFFDKVLTEKLLQRKADEDRKAGVLTSLLQMELNQQAQDRQWLLDRSIALPETDQTSKFAEIVDLTGNMKLETTLNLMLDSAKQHSGYLSNAINQYNQGVQLANSFEAQQLAASEGEYGADQYLYNEEEIQGLMDEGKIDPELWKNETYQQGFYAGAMDLTEAMKNVDIQNNIYAQNRALETGEIQKAIEFNGQLMESVGGDIVLNTVKYNLPFAAFKGALGAVSYTHLTLPTTPYV